MASPFAGTSLVIVEPAAVKAFFPICIGAIKLVLQPINACSSTTVLYLFFPSKLTVTVPQPKLTFLPKSASPQ